MRLARAELNDGNSSMVRRNEVQAEWKEPLAQRAVAGVAAWLAIRTWARVVSCHSRQLQAGFVVAGGWPRLE